MHMPCMGTSFKLLPLLQFCLDEAETSPAYSPYIPAWGLCFVLRYFKYSSIYDSPNLDICAIINEWDATFKMLLILQSCFNKTETSPACSLYIPACGLCFVLRYFKYSSIYGSLNLDICA